MLPGWGWKQVLQPPTSMGSVSPGLAFGLTLANRTQWVKLGWVASGRIASRTTSVACNNVLCICWTSVPLLSVEGLPLQT